MRSSRPKTGAISLQRMVSARPNSPISKPAKQTTIHGAEQQVNSIGNARTGFGDGGRWGVCLLALRSDLSRIVPGRCQCQSTEQTTDSGNEFVRFIRFNN